MHLPRTSSSPCSRSVVCVAYEGERHHLPTWYFLIRLRKCNWVLNELTMATSLEKNMFSLFYPCHPSAAVECDMPTIIIPHMEYKGNPLPSYDST